MTMGLTGTVAGFFRWWITELAAMIPARMRRSLGTSEQRVVFVLDEPELAVRRTAHDGAAEIGRVRLDAGRVEETQRAVSVVLDEAGIRAPALTLRLPSRDALYKTLELPAAAAENLREVLSFEMDRHTPFASDDVYFDYVVRHRDRATQRLRVDVVIVPRATVEAALRRLRDLGFEPDVVDVVDAPSDPLASAPVNLLGGGEYQHARRSGGRMSMALAVLAIGLAAAALLVPLERQKAMVSDLATEAKQAKQTAEQTNSLRHQRDAILSSNRQLTERKKASLPFIQVLNAVTSVMPDDTWLLRLRYAENQVQTIGFSTNASQLIARIEDSPLFSDVRFLAPITRSAREEADRFQIGFRAASDDNQ